MISPPPSPHYGSTESEGIAPRRLARFFCCICLPFFFLTRERFLAGLRCSVPRALSPTQPSPPKAVQSEGPAAACRKDWTGGGFQPRAAHSVTRWLPLRIPARPLLEASPTIYRGRPPISRPPAQLCSQRIAHTSLTTPSPALVCAVTNNDVRRQSAALAASDAIPPGPGRLPAEQKRSQIVVEGLQATVQASGRSWYGPDASVSSRDPSRCLCPRRRSSLQRGRAGAIPPQACCRVK